MALPLMPCLRSLLRSLVYPAPARGAIALVMAGGVAIASCRPSPPEPGLQPTPPTTAAPAPDPPTAAVPTDTPTPAAASLPNSLIAQWQPLSDVLLVFGPMTLTADRVQWGSGQTSPYTLISTEGGYLLQLESSPSFYDTQNRYIKLIPTVDATGNFDSIDVAFYPSDTQLADDEYVMYGSYFIE